MTDATTAWQDPVLAVHIPGEISKLLLLHHTAIMCTAAYSYSNCRHLYVQQTPLLQLLKRVKQLLVDSFEQCPTLAHHLICHAQVSGRAH